MNLSVMSVRAAFSSCLVLCLAALSASASPAQVDHTPQSRELTTAPYRRHYARRSVCGTNSLYLVLKLLGADYSFREIDRICPRNADGASILQLRDAARRLGYVAEVKQFSLDALRDSRHPVIAHMKKSYINTSRGGHFVVVLQASDDGIQLIDGTTGELRTAMPEKFVRRWSGHILEVRPAATWTPFCLVVANGAIWTACIVYLAFPIRSGIAFLQAIALATTAWIALFYAFASNLRFSASVAQPAVTTIDSGDASNVSSPSWRIPSHDGINCLYLLLRHYGRDVDYNSLCSRLRPGHNANSLLELRDAARDLGLSTEVVYSSPESLEAENFPVVVYFDSLRADGGGFGVLVAMKEGGFMMVDGSSVEIGPVNIDEFRRGWSGYSLVVRKPQSSFLAIVCGVTSFIGLVPLIWRTRRPDCKHSLAEPS